MGRDQELKLLAFSLYPLSFFLYCPFKVGVLKVEFALKLKIYRSLKSLICLKWIHNIAGHSLFKFWRNSCVQNSFKFHYYIIQLYVFRFDYPTSAELLSETTFLNTSPGMKKMTIWNSIQWRFHISGMFDYQRYL